MNTPSQTPFAKLLRRIRDWSDLWLFLPVLVGVMIYSDIWVRKLDPTAAVMSAESLSMLSFNLVKLFVISPTIAILWHVWVGGRIFPSTWQEGLTKWEVVKTKLFVLSGLFILVYFCLNAHL